jgi:hypothetical protein
LASKGNLNSAYAQDLTLLIENANKPKNKKTKDNEDPFAAEMKKIFSKNAGHKL